MCISVCRFIGEENGDRIPSFHIPQLSPTSSNQLASPDSDSPFTLRRPSFSSFTNDDDDGFLDVLDDVEVRCVLAVENRNVYWNVWDCVATNERNIGVCFSFPYADRLTLMYQWEWPVYSPLLWLLTKAQMLQTL